MEYEGLRSSGFNVQYSTSGQPSSSTTLTRKEATVLELHLKPYKSFLSQKKGRCGNASNIAFCGVPNGYRGQVAMHVWLRMETESAATCQESQRTGLQVRILGRSRLRCHVPNVNND